MSRLTTPIAIVDADRAVLAGGCGACLHGADVQACIGATASSWVAPTLHGPADEVAALVSALSQRLDMAGEAAPSRWLNALTVQPGEVELTLNMASHCTGSALADAAFQVLRSLRPDTDIYVRLAAV